MGHRGRTNPPEILNLGPHPLGVAICSSFSGLARSARVPDLVVAPQRGVWGALVRSVGCIGSSDSVGSPSGVSPTTLPVWEKGRSGGVFGRGLLIAGRARIVLPMFSFRTARQVELDASLRDLSDRLKSLERDREAFEVHRGALISVLTALEARVRSLVHRAKAPQPAETNGAVEALLKHRGY